MNGPSFVHNINIVQIKLKEVQLRFYFSNPYLNIHSYSVKLLISTDECFNIFEERFFYNINIQNDLYLKNY
jgi:hypothetical protein